MKRIPQEKIKTFLQSFWPEWTQTSNNQPLSLLDVVEDVVQEFNPSETERTELSAKRGENDRPLLNTKVHFALNELIVEGFLFRIGPGMYQLKTSPTFSGTVTSDDIETARTGLHQLRTACGMTREQAKDFLLAKSNYHPHAVLAADSIE